MAVNLVAFERHNRQSSRPPASQQQGPAFRQYNCRSFSPRCCTVEMFPLAERLQSSEFLTSDIAAAKAWPSAVQLFEVPLATLKPSKVPPGDVTSVEHPDFRCHSCQRSQPSGIAIVEVLPSERSELSKFLSLAVQSSKFPTSNVPAAKVLPFSSTTVEGPASDSTIVKGPAERFQSSKFLSLTIQLTWATLVKRPHLCSGNHSII